MCRDLEKNVGSGSSTAGSMPPSFLTHGTLHSWTADRVLTVKELNFAHGFNVFPDQRGRSSAHILESLPPGQQKNLLGNGWHLPALASWVFYILCLCQSESTWLSAARARIASVGKAIPRRAKNEGSCAISPCRSFQKVVNRHLMLRSCATDCICLPTAQACA